MASGDELRSTIRQARDLVTEAVANGAGSVSEANRAIRQMYQAIDLLEGSRVYAGQQLGNLNDAVNLLMLEVLQSNNSNAHAAFNRIDEARHKVEQYYNTMSNRIDTLKRMTQIAEKYMLDTVDSAALPLQKAVESLENWERTV